MGWAGLKNGDLLLRDENQFEVLITMDSNMRFQQNLSKYRVAIVVLQAPSNRLLDTRPLMPKVLAILATVRPGTVTIVSAP